MPEVPSQECVLGVTSIERLAFFGDSAARAVFVQYDFGQDAPPAGGTRSICVGRVDPNGCWSARCAECGVLQLYNDLVRRVPFCVWLRGLAFAVAATVGFSLGVGPGDE